MSNNPSSRTVGGNPLLTVTQWISLLPPQYQRAWREGRMTPDYFVYVAEILPLPASGTGVATFNIEADSDFAWLYGTRFVTDSANANPQANVLETVNIRDSGSGRVLSNTAVAMDNYFGTVQQPNVLAQPKLFRAGGTVQVTVQNLEAVARNVRLAFHGAKLFLLGNN